MAEGMPIFLVQTPQGWGKQKHIDPAHIDLTLVLARSHAASVAHLRSRRTSSIATLKTSANASLAPEATRAEGHPCKRSSDRLHPFYSSTQDSEPARPEELITPKQRQRDIAKSRYGAHQLKFRLNLPRRLPYDKSASAHRNVQHGHTLPRAVDDNTLDPFLRTAITLSAYDRHVLHLCSCLYPLTCASSC